VRLRSLKFNYEPESYTPVVIDELADLNKLTMVSPLRLEIETQFLVADELRPAHTRLTRRLNNKGITVYCNTPLLGGINDMPEAIHQLALAAGRPASNSTTSMWPGCLSRTAGTGKTRWPFTMWSTSPRGCGGRAAGGRCPGTSSVRCSERWISAVVHDLSARVRIFRQTAALRPRSYFTPWLRISAGRRDVEEDDRRQAVVPVPVC
jgi:hypothetical protein